MQEAVRITWLGHSCFKMEYKGWSLITDPYADGSVRGLPPLRQEADAVFCSHRHDDHNAVNVLTITGAAPPEDFSLEERTCSHGPGRGKNTIRLFHFGPLRVAHMGDVGEIPEEETISLLHGCNLLLIPVGGFYTIDGTTAAELVNRIEPRAVLPMHYREGSVGYDVIDTLGPFLAFFPKSRRLGGQKITLTEERPRGVLVLNSVFEVITDNEKPQE